MNNDNDNYDEEFARIKEALTIEKTLIPAGMPPWWGGFVGVGNWDWWDRNMGHGCRTKKLTGNQFDTVYLNQEGKRHRLFGPAYINTVYDIEIWYKDGEYHRIGGPAIRHKTTHWWFKEGRPHNLDGPAVVAGGMPPLYYIDGRKYSPKEYKKEIQRRRIKGLI
jgi:hypothetical protein